MNDLLLKGWVKADIARKSFFDNLSERRESGDIVQTIIIIAMFVLIVVVVGNILYEAINGQAVKVGECIENPNNAGNCRDFSG